MLKLLFLLALSQGERVWKEEIFFKKMPKFSFLKEEPSMIMLTEMLEF